MKRFGRYSLTFTGISKVSTCLLIFAWFYANLQSIQWLLQALMQTSRFTLMLISVAAIALLVQVIIRYRRSELAIHPNLIFTRLRLAPVPLLLMLGSVIVAIALTWLINLEQIAALLFLLGTYGLIGLFIQPFIWQKNLPVAALIAVIIPFASQYTTGLGIPARVLTAHAVEQLLSTWHISAISSHEIIVLENGIAHVDIPCSGIKSLWTGTVFLLAASWLEGRILGARWLLVCCTSLCLLVSVNILRVLVLVILTYVIKQPKLAEILHLPLGVLGFILACAVTWLLLQKVPKNQQSIHLDQEDLEIKKTTDFYSYNQTVFKRKSLIITAIVVALMLMPQLRYVQKEMLAIAPIQFPPEIVSEPISLTAVEQKVFGNQPHTTIEKRRFLFRDISGSILFVSSTLWQSYHPPEVCLLGSGLNVDRIERKILTPRILGRWLSLQNHQLSAIYWMQSSQQTTDNFLERIWSQITHKNQVWVLVSVLFDGSVNPDNSQLRDFAATIHAVINRNLNKD